MVSDCLKGKDEQDFGTAVTATSMDAPFCQTRSAGWGLTKGPVCAAAAVGATTGADHALLRARVVRKTQSSFSRDPAHNATGS